MFKKNLERFRGDTYPDVFTLKDSAGAAVDITGYSFLMSVDIDENPANADNQVYQITGVIVGAASDGQFSFTPTAMQADQDPKGKYFYDVQMTDSGGAITTIAKGKLVYKQDITK